MSHQHAAGFVESFLRFHIQPITAALVLRALETKERYRISYWDAAILEAARLQGCRRVLSEDLAHGQSYEGILVENPFFD